MAHARKRGSAGELLTTEPSLESHTFFLLINFLHESRYMKPVIVGLPPSSMSWLEF